MVVFFDLAHIFYWMTVLLVTSTRRLKPTGIIIKSLDPLREKKTCIREKLGHTAVSTIKASSVTL